MMRITVLAFLLLFQFSALAQEDFIHGKLLDANTNEPVVFATLRLKHKAMGVITNQDGGFRFPKRFQQLDDILVISCMGYEKKEIPLSRLSPNGINTIRIKLGVLALQETVVTAKKKRGLSARAIVKRAIAAIPQNYPKNTFSTVGYYRDYQMSNGQYVNLNEAILEVFDEGFDTVDTTDTKVMLYDYKQNNQFKRDTLADNPYDYTNLEKIIENAYMPAHDGNEFNILRVHDPIRNHNINSFDLINKMEEDFIKNHSFKKEPDVVLDNELLFKIRINRIHPIAKVIGWIYISKTDYAIHKIEYSVYDRLKKIVGDVSERKKGNLIFETTAEYNRDPEQKMFLNYVSFYNKFRLSPPPIFTIDSIAFVPSKKGFMVYLNQKLRQNDEPENKANYEVKFKGNALRLKKIKVYRNSFKVFQDSLMIYLDVSMVKLSKMANEIATASASEDVLEIKIENLTDIQGNLLNEWKSLEFNQFREYFVQKVKPFAQIPKDALFMRKNKPIFESQPLIRPKNSEEYWMNTPLVNNE
ncbi:MAG: carboxypeptidase-like regulatory domain-containing protein [Bacteroidota bacterium]